MGKKISNPPPPKKRTFTQCKIDAILSSAPIPFVNVERVEFKNAFNHLKSEIIELISDLEDKMNGVVHYETGNKNTQKFDLGHHTNM